MQTMELRFAINGLINGDLCWVAHGSLRGWPIWTLSRADAATWPTRRAARAWAGPLLQQPSIAIDMGLWLTKGA